MTKLSLKKVTTTAATVAAAASVSANNSDHSGPRMTAAYSYVLIYGSANDAISDIYAFIEPPSVAGASNQLESGPRRESSESATLCV